jgi:hypothetical protein
MPAVEQPEKIAEVAIQREKLQAHFAFGAIAVADIIADRRSR